MGLFSSLFSPTKKANRISSVLSCPHTEPYVILDVETTGLSPTADKIIQLSSIKYSANGTPLDSYNTYLNPGTHIPSRITKITSITDETVRNAPTANQVRPHFLSFIADSLLVGYNVTFDLRFLSAEFGDVLNERLYVDVLRIARDFLLCPNYKLQTVAEECGFFPNASFHDSLIDCEAVAAILSSIDSLPLDLYIDRFSMSKKLLKVSRSETPVCSQTKLGDISVQQADCLSTQSLLQKNIVFIGLSSIPRYELAHMAELAGAIISGTISSETDILVVGEKRPDLIDTDGLLKKERQALELNQSNKANIQIINENEFLNLLR